MTDKPNEPWRHLSLSLTDFCKEFLLLPMEDWQLRQLKSMDNVCDVRLKPQNGGLSDDKKAYLLAMDLFRGHVTEMTIVSPTIKEAEKFTALVKKHLKEFQDVNGPIDEPNARPSDPPDREDVPPRQQIPKSPMRGHWPK